jgi:hypothetical protein
LHKRISARALVAGESRRVVRDAPRTRGYGTCVSVRKFDSLEEVAVAAFTKRDDTRVSWGTAIVAGIIAMVVFAIVEMAFSWAMRGQSPWHPLAVFGTATIDALLPDTHAGGGPRTIVIGAALLLVLGALSGAILAMIVDRVGVTTAAIAGVVFGLAMFVVDLYGVARLLPVLHELRDWMSALAYAIQGGLAAGLYKATTHHERPIVAPPGPDLRDLRHAPLA